MILSKTSLLKGFQCCRQLYLYKFNHELMDEVDDSTQAKFDTGHSIGELAQSLFPGGVNCSAGSAWEYQECADKTKKEIYSGAKVIYEAGIIYDDIIAIADIFEIKKDGIHIYEVKSTTEVKDVHILDAAIQYYVVTRAGFKVKDISIIHINNKYVRTGDLEINKLFSIDSVMDEVLEQQRVIKKTIKDLKKMLTERIDPGSELGPQCSDPYDCSFLGYCWRDIPDYSVFNICNLKTEKKFELYRQGILNLEDIPKDYHLSELQKVQVNSYMEGRDYIDEESIKKFMKEIPLPVLFMDFETFMPAVPMFNNSHPYQQIPFQFSVHHMDEKKKLKHYSFLAETDGDPRSSFIENLIMATEGEETILVYNQSFEISRLKELAQDFPKHCKQLSNLIIRIKDLMTPFQRKWFYSNDMEGSYSIKSVLPALVPELSYNDLEISEGGTASRVFESLYYEKDKKIIEIIRNNLLEYCKTDTLAMAEIYNHLNQVWQS